MSEIGGFFNDATGASDAAQAAHRSMDTLNRQNHLPGNQAPSESKLQKAGKVLGQIKDVTGGVVGIKADAKALAPGN
jgi:hypothetical protein